MRVRGHDAGAAALLTVTIVLMILSMALLANASPVAGDEQVSNAQPSVLYEVYVNTGGGVYTDTLGHRWLADRAYSSGSWGYVGGTAGTWAYPIAGTNDDQLYQSIRWWSSITGTYRFDDAPPGVYEVDLRFAELTMSDWGKRLFDVEIAGVKYLSHMDIWSAAGANTTYDWTFVVTHTSGPLRINFVPHQGSNPSGSSNTALVNGLHVRQLESYNPPPSAPYPRIGIGVNWAWGDIDDYDVAQLHLGWYATWSLRLTVPQPNGIEFVQLINTRGVVSTTYDWTIVGNVIARNPGSTYIIGNEMEAPYQGNHTPAQFAGLYNAFYHYIKGRDPTAKVGVGGVVMVSEARLRWLQGVLDAYAAAHNDDDMPVDFWTVHEQILGGAEYSVGNVTNWPVGIGVPLAGENEYHDWTCNKPGGPNDLQQFKNDIIRFRQWMNQKGYRDRPLWISEYGVLGGDNYNCTQKVIGQYLVQTMDWLNTATNDSLGQPGDDNRLVQRWLWYSMNDQPYNKDTGLGFAGAVHYHDSPVYPGAMTGVGRAFRDWVNSITPPGPTATPTETRTPTVTPTPTATRTPLPEGSGVLQGAVQLQGRGSAPSTLWTVPLTVGLYLPGDSVPAYQFEATTDEAGGFTVPAASTPGVWPSSYNVKVKNPQMLQAGATGLAIAADVPTAHDFGLLRGGDANNDNRVSLTDLNIVSVSYGKGAGDTGYDARGDLTGDARVSLADLNTLSVNYGQSGLASDAAQPTLGLAASLDAAPAATFAVQPATSSWWLGNQFTVQVNMNVASGSVSAADFTLSYNPAVLSVVSVSCLSTFNLGAPGHCTAAGGTARFAASISGGGSVGSSWMMRVVFRSIATATNSPLLFTNRQPDAVCNPATECGAASYAEGTVTITNPPTPTRTPTLCIGCPTHTATPTPQPLNIGVNAGGPAHTDRQGYGWQADKAYAAGSWGYIGGAGQTYSTSSAIAGTEDDTLYQTERWGMTQYAFDVAPGVYSVTLKFAEIYYATSVGGRVFDVKVEGRTVVDDLDVLKEVGRYTALDRSFLVTVDDWQLNLEFSATMGSAKVNAIRIAYASGGAPTATPTATATSPVATATATVTRTPTATQQPKDPFEPNETFEQATAMSPNTDYLGYIESEQDVDMYAFTVNDPNSYIWVSLTDLPADYDLFLYAPDRSLAAWSTYAGLTPEYILNHPAGGQTGQYYLRVVGYARAMNADAPYRLRLELRSATPTATATSTATGTATPTRTPTATATRQPQDPNEPNNTYDQATVLTAGVAMFGYMDSASDVDYFRLNVPAAGKVVAVSLTLLPADYDLYLADSGRNVVAMSRYGGVANEFIFYTAPAAGTYYIYVAGYNHAYNPSATYRLLAQVN